MPPSSLAPSLLFFSFSLAAATGCAATAPFTCPDRGGPAWRELTSAHFVLRTDLAEDDAREAVEEYERIQSAFEDIAFPFATKPTGRALVYVLSRDEEFEIIAPENAAAYFTELHDAGVESTPAIVLPGALSSRTRVEFQHELTHRFAHFYYPTVPRWLDEGLAQYYSTLWLEGGSALIGAPLPSIAFTHGGWATRNEPPWIRALVPFSDLPELEVLLASDGTFDAHVNARVAAYAESWALVRLLHMGPPAYKARLDKLFGELGRGQPARAAVDAAFRDVSLEQVREDLEKLIVDPNAKALSTPYTPRTSPVESARTLSDAEVHQAWLELRGWGSPPDAEKAKDDLAEALAKAPGSLGPLLWSARFHATTGRAPEAVRDLEKARAIAPHDPRFLVAQFSLRRRIEEARPAGDRRWERVEELLPELAERASSAAELNEIARYFAHRGRPDDALPYARRMVKKDPTCWRCLDTYAAIAYQKGDLKEAVDGQLLAVNLIPEYVKPAGVTARLKAYRRAAEARAAAEQAGQPAPPLSPIDLAF